MFLYFNYFVIVSILLLQRHWFVQLNLNSRCLNRVGTNFSIVQECSNVMALDCIRLYLENLDLQLIPYGRFSWTEWIVPSKYTLHNSYLSYE